MVGWGALTRDLRRWPHEVVAACHGASGEHPAAASLGVAIQRFVRRPGGKFSA